MNFRHKIRPYYSHRAEALLQSWICGDITNLHSELDNAVDSRWTPKDGMDRYSVELLKVVARGMRSCPNLYVSRTVNPEVGIYMDILQQLSTSGVYASESSPRHATSGLRLVKRSS